MYSLMEIESEVSLKTLLSGHTREGELWKSAPDGRIECFACGHRCKIGEGKDGICKVRFNRGGRLFVPWGYAAGIQLDPIEKKPFYHVLPGCTALSFGMLGCDYHCSYCQNWITSQALRDPAAVSPPEFVTAEQLGTLAVRHGADVVTSTYNEPLITSEWGVEVFRRARAAGLLTSYVSNGNATPEVLAYLRPWIDLYKVDLKGFDDRRYRSLGGLLTTVLETIRRLHELGVWVEVVTLVVPGFNDSQGELRDIAAFLKSVSANIPWHVTAFHPDYRMEGVQRTEAASLIRAVEIGYESGLNFVYGGNIPGMVRNYENTYCPSCSGVLVERIGFRVRRNMLVDGSCPKCHAAIPGVWSRPRRTTA